jgi:uncharacterized protein (TIGR02145 family)
MRGKFLLSLLFLHGLLSLNAQVIVTVTGKSKGIPVTLDTIRVINVSHPGSLVLYPLPSGVTSYNIDLMKGKIINSVSQDKLDPDISIESNGPGMMKIRIYPKKSCGYSISLYSVTGKLLCMKEMVLPVGNNRVSIVAGNEPLTIVRISSQNKMLCSFKIIGDPVVESKPGIMWEQSYDELKSGSGTYSCDTNGFIYSPGDSILFTVCKTGMNPNFQGSVPQNLDSVNIPLFAFCPGTPITYDFDGNKYHTVLIGTQCWMKENIKSRHYSDGVSLVDGTGKGSIWGDYTTQYWFDYNDDPSFSDIYGRLYTGAAVCRGVLVNPWDTIRVQGICPQGWHVPSDAEWMRMEAFLGMGSDTIGMAMWRGTDQGAQIKEAGPIHWGNYNTGTDTVGFAGLPAGVRGLFGDFKNVGYETVWWTGTSQGIYKVSREVTDILYQIYRDAEFSTLGASCRCIKD